MFSGRHAVKSAACDVLPQQSWSNSGEKCSTLAAVTETESERQQSE